MSAWLVPESPLAAIAPRAVYAEGPPPHLRDRPGGEGAEARRPTASFDGPQGDRRPRVGGAQEDPPGRAIRASPRVVLRGDGPEPTTRIVQDRLPSWVGRAETVVHVDFHTGLGDHGNYKLLLIDAEGSSRAAWVGRHFGSDEIEPCRRGDGLRGAGVDGGVFHPALLGSGLPLPDGGIRDVCPDPGPGGLEGREPGPPPRQAGLPLL